MIGLTNSVIFHSILSSCPRVSGWWFGTFFIFPYIGNDHPNWLIFFRGVQTTNQVLLVLYCCISPYFVGRIPINRHLYYHMTISIPLFFILLPLFYSSSANIHHISGDFHCFQFITTFMITTSNIFLSFFHQTAIHLPLRWSTPHGITPQFSSIYRWDVHVPWSKESSVFGVHP